MTFMDIAVIVLDTLIIYSIIATASYFMSGENEDVLICFGFGIIGLLLFGFSRIISKIQRLFKYHMGKRSIFEDKENKQKYKCKTDLADDINWLPGYRMIKRYADKKDWEDIPDFPDDIIEKSQRNCDRCRFNKECDCGSPYDKIRCKHDEWGLVLEFNKFEKKMRRRCGC